MKGVPFSTKGIRKGVPFLSKMVYKRVRVWLESAELTIDKRKFLLNRLFVKQQVPEEDEN